MVAILLTARQRLNLVEDGSIGFSFNMKTIENLHSLLTDNVCKKLFKVDKDIQTPLEVIDSLYEYNENILIMLLFASSNENDLDTFKELIAPLEDDLKRVIFNAIRSIIYTSMLYTEPSEEEEDRSNTVKDKTQNSLQQFEDWYNYLYCNSIDTLHVSLEEFYSLTPAQIKERIYYKQLYDKNTLIRTYVTVMKAQSNSKDDKKEFIEIDNPWNFFDGI